jgi:RimJ/RimL family protein N-acetyltransferase
LLEGKNVNLKIVEKEDLPLFTQFLNDLEVGGDYMPILQQSRVEIEKKYDKLPPEEKWFFIEKKDGSKIGWISHCLTGGNMTIEYALISSERNKGYCTEAVKIMIDYLFLSKDIVSIQAEALTENSASQRVLEKAGFKKEGITRKSSFVKGDWHDDVLYSILREEWKEPKMLTKTTSRQQH